MRKIGGVLLAAAVLSLILAGCGNSQRNSGSRGEERQNAQSAQNPQGSQDSPFRPALPEIGQTPESPSAYTPGQRTEEGYRSDWIGLEYTAGSAMVLATDEEIASMMNITEGSTTLGVAGQHASDADSITTLYEMVAVNVTTQANLFICVEKLVLSSITEEQYAAAVQSQIESLYAGYTITYRENRERQLCGLAFLEMGYYLEGDDGFAIHQSYLVRKQGNRMIGIVLSCMDESELETLLSGFSAVS